MEYGDILKIYGPMGIGWIIAGYLGKFILDRYQADIDSRVKLSEAITGLTNMIKDSLKGHS